MSPLFLLMPGCSSWQIVDVRSGLPPTSLTSGSLEPVARNSAGPTPTIQNREPRK